MPEQNPQNVAAFNPANFSLPASLTTNEVPTLVYSVIAKTDQPSLSYYTQTVFHRSSGTPSPGARLTDQAQPAVRNAEDMPSYSNNDVYSQTTTAPQTFAPPIINAQQYREQNTQPYRLTDQTPVVGDAIYYPTAPAQSNESFAPPANRSTLPYVPKENLQQRDRSETSKSVLDVSKRTAPKLGSENSDPFHAQALVEKTKLVDLRPRSKKSAELFIAKQPARDVNTTVEEQASSSTPEESVELYSETGFLKRQAFSSKFSVTQAKAQENKTTKKVIYLKSAPAKQKSAKLEVPQFKQPVTSKTESVQPKLVPDYAMLPPIPQQTQSAEMASTVNEPATMPPEATTPKTKIEFTKEPTAAFSNPFEAVKEDVKETIEQPFEALAVPVDEDFQASTSNSSPFEMTETKLFETETQQVETAPKISVPKFQPIQQPLPNVENAAPQTPASGFSDSDFTQLENTTFADAPPTTARDSHETPFQVAGYRQAKATTKFESHSGKNRTSISKRHASTNADYFAEI